MGVSRQKSMALSRQSSFMALSKQSSCELGEDIYCDRFPLWEYFTITTLVLLIIIYCGLTVVAVSRQYKEEGNCQMAMVGEETQLLMAELEYTIPPLELDVSTTPRRMLVPWIPNTHYQGKALSKINDTLRK